MPGSGVQVLKHSVPVFYLNHEGQLEVVAGLNNILQRIVKKDTQLSRITRSEGRRWMKNVRDNQHKKQDCSNN